MKKAILIETDVSMQRYFQKLMQKHLGYSVFPIKSIQECDKLMAQHKGFEVVVCNYDVTTDDEDQILDYVRLKIPGIDAYMLGYMRKKEVMRRGDKVTFCTEDEFLEMFVPKKPRVSLLCQENASQHA